MRGAARHHGRGARRRRRAASAAGDLRGSRRGAVRLLYARHSRDREGAPRRTSAPDAGSDSGRALRQPVPLHRLPADLRGGRSGDCRRERGMKIIGKSRRRVDARAKVTGQTRFADDLMLPRMLHCKLLRSTLPHARIVRIDASRALQNPGVHLVLTGRDFPISYGILPVSQDEHGLAVDRVRFVGDPVAAVIARDELTAFEALDLIDVEYEPLRTFSTPEESLGLDRGEGAPGVDRGAGAPGVDRGAGAPGVDDVPRIHEYGDRGNIHKIVSLGFGDVEQAF